MAAHRMTRILLREILERNGIPAREPITHDAANCFDATLSKCECNNCADDDATDATECNALKKHLITKKCHHCHLFFFTIVDTLQFLPRSKDVQDDNTLVPSGRKHER